MIVVFCLVSALSLAPTTITEPRETIGESRYFNSSDPAELERQLKRSFGLSDADADGFITTSEAPMAERGRTNEAGQRIAQEAGTNLWIRTMDTSGDSRVDWAEMRDYLLPRMIKANADR